MRKRSGSADENRSLTVAALINGDDRYATVIDLSR